MEDRKILPESKFRVLTIASLVLTLTISSIAQAGLSEWEAIINGANPLHWYKFDETGSDCIDSGSEGLDGTYYDVLVAQEGFFGSGTAVEFERNGTNRVNFENAMDLPGPWTVEYIVKTTKEPAGYDSQALHDSDNFSIRLAGWTPLGEAGFTQYGIADCRFTPEEDLTLDDLVIQPNIWMHLVWRNDGNGTQLFFNGRLVGTSSDSIDLPRLRIGARRAGPADHLMGVLDETVVFDRALSEADIITHAVACDLVAAGDFVEPRAIKPVPADGSVCTNNWVELSWTPGDLSASHHVYLGTDLNAVSQRKESELIATTTVPFVSVGLSGSAFPNGLQIGTSYYWCVDEVNDIEPNSPWWGEVWSFWIPAEPVAYLLITSEELAPAFQPLVDWRTADELPGKFVTLEHICSNYTGVDKQDQIRNCIRDYYENNGTIYVTLGGDDVIVPVRYCYANGSYKILTDLYYGGLDGTWDEDGDGIYGEANEDNADLYPEVWVGRIPVRTAQQATDYVNKVFFYESRSPDGFSQTMLIAGDLQSANISGTERSVNFLDHDPVSGDEVEMVNFYRNGVQQYWHATPMHKLIDSISSWDITRCGDYDFTPSHLSDRLNWGYHHVWIRAHGGRTKYDFERKGRRELFYPEDALALTNSERLSIIYGEGCNTGGFDAEPCISEAFLRCPNGGAVVYVGCSSTNYATHYNLFYREIFVNKRERIGEAFGYYKMGWAHESKADDWRRQVQFGRNLQGDSALRILGAESVRDLHLSSPHGCEVIELGTDFTIRWNASGTDFEPDETVHLSYSPDSGHTWHLIPGAGSLPFNGRSFTWKNCPLSAGSQYRVRVTSETDPSVSHSSERDFTIGKLALLTVQSNPIENVLINISSDTTDDSSILTNFNITVLEGATVNVSAPAREGESSEFTFVRWKDESSNTSTNTLDYTFILTEDKTIITEYTGP